MRGSRRGRVRLLMYERRIESSLYRTMAQLRREREARRARPAAVEPEEASRPEGNLPAGQESATRAKLASFGAEPVPAGGEEGILSLKGRVSTAEGGVSGDASDFTPQMRQDVMRNEPNFRGQACLGCTS